MNKGFTLIELLVAAAIFSLLTGGGIASYVRFNEREKLKAAALMVKTYLRKAQTNALAGVKNEEQCQERPLDGWCLDMYRGYLYGHCGGPKNLNPSSVDFNVESYTLPKGVSIFFDPPDWRGGILMFKPLGQGVDKNMTICLSASTLGITSFYRLSVSTSGEIVDEGLVKSCP